MEPIEAQRSKSSISTSLLFPILESSRQLMETLRQLPHRSESDFVSWASKRGVPLAGIVSNTDVSFFWKQGWLRVDDVFETPRDWRLNTHGVRPRFVEHKIFPETPRDPALDCRFELYLHPFRIFTASALLLPFFSTSRTADLYRPDQSKASDFLSDQAKAWTASEGFPREIDWLNGLADLAIMLEPLFWPDICGRIRGHQVRAGRECEEVLQLRNMVFTLLEDIGREDLEHAHEQLRFKAANLDRNAELYLFLRCLNWDKRDRLEGELGGSMWFRHIAEVLRRGYESVFDGRLPHEDRAYGSWFPGMREWLYGSDHPTDNLAEFSSRALPGWGVQTGIRVRVYVEGDTEKGALTWALTGLLGLAVEIVNVRGSDWGVWLKDELGNDVQARRFSVLILDADRADSIRSVRQHVKDGLIVGRVFIQAPDFEMCCFTVDELCAAAELLERSRGLVEVPPLDRANFSGVVSGKTFEQAYIKARSAPAIKGEEWGQALAELAFEANSVNEHPFARIARFVYGYVEADYDIEKYGHPVNSTTLENERTGWRPGDPV